MKGKKSNRKLISICVPVLNEELNIELLYFALNELAQKVEKKYDFEFLFTDNKSSDASWDVIKILRKKDSRIRGYQFTKNIGFQQSIYFNYMQAHGDAVVQIDADLQDSPSVILDFLKEWDKGFKVVVGVRRNRKENWFETKFRKIGYAFISRMARFRITENAGDFRLIDREVVEILRQSQNPNPYLRGAIAGIGFPEKQVFYDRKNRENGESKFGLKAVLKLGFEGLINYSNFLLRVSQFVLILSLVLSLVGVFAYIVTKVSNETTVLPPGLTSTIVLIFISITINALFFAVCIKYLDNIYRVVTKNEPVVVLDRI